jgi:hypothetical protein
LIGALHYLSLTCPACATAQELSADLLYPGTQVRCRSCGFGLGAWDRLRARARVYDPDYSGFSLVEYEEAERLLDAAWTKVHRNDTADTALRVGRASATLARSRACLDAHPDPAVKA